MPSSGATRGENRPQGLDRSTPKLPLAGHPALRPALLRIRSLEPPAEQLGPPHLTGPGLWAPASWLLLYIPSAVS